MKATTKVFIDRILKIDYLIRHQNVNKNILSIKIGVSQKTIQRYLVYMKRDYKAPIKYNPKTRNLYYSNSFSISEFTLNEQDLFMLAVTDKVLSQYKGTIYEDLMKTFYSKINTLFNNEEIYQLEDIQDLMSFDIGPIHEINKEVFDTIEKSIIDRRTITVDYTSLKQKARQKKEFDPYHIRNYKGDWYLLGFDHSKNKIRVLKVSRIHSAEFSGKKKFEHTEKFDRDSYFKFSFGNYIGKKIYDVKIRFSPELAPRIKEKIWHETQNIKEFKNGSIIINFKLNSIKEIKKWILQYGKGCKVLSPKELQSMIKEEITEMRRVYNI